MGGVLLGRRRVWLRDESPSSCHSISLFFDSSVLREPDDFASVVLRDGALHVGLDRLRRFFVFFIMFLRTDIGVLV